MAIPHNTLPKFSIKDFSRFWSHVERKDQNDCWPWVFTTIQGYGRFTIHDNYKVKHYPAHRIAYYLASGDDPLELLICHKCDNRLCCNPNHLFKGTNEDNQKDSALKDRTAFGEKHAHAKLKTADIPEIHRLWAMGLTQDAIGAKFGVSQTAIGRVILGHTWKRSHPSYVILHDRPDKITKSKSCE